MAERRITVRPSELVALEFRCTECDKMTMVAAEKFKGTECCPRCGKMLMPLKRVLEGLAQFASAMVGDKDFAFTLVTRE